MYLNTQLIFLVDFFVFILLVKTFLIKRLICILVQAPYVQVDQEQTADCLLRAAQA